MKKLILIASSSVVLLAGCAQYSDDLAMLDNKMANPTISPTATTSPQDIMPASGDALLNEKTFSNYLAQEYYALARYENDQAFDYKAAQNFTKKAMVASKGEIVEPSKLTASDLPEEHIPALSKARDTLMTALRDKKTPENAITLAMAQGRFECWLDRVEDAKNDDHITSCKQEFEQYMNVLDASLSVSMPAMFNISFVGDTTQVDAASLQNILLLEQFLKDPVHANHKVQLMGVATDTKDIKPVDVATSRTQTIKSLLLSKGIAPDRITAGLSPTILEEGSAGKVEAMIVSPEPQPQSAKNIPVYPAVQVSPPTNM